MKTMTRMLLLSAAAALAAGCSTTQFEPVAVEELHNAQGHVIGQKEVLCDCRTGERLARLSLYVPRYDDGRLVGYEEVVRGGSILRDLNGKAIGNRFVDLRSKGMNTGNRGLTVVFVQPASTRVAMSAAPSIDELMRLARINVN